MRVIINDKAHPVADAAEAQERVDIAAAQGVHLTDNPGGGCSLLDVPPTPACGAGRPTLTPDEIVAWLAEDPSEFRRTVAAQAIRWLVRKGTPPAQHEHHYRERLGDDGPEYVCECGAHCPHQWPDDIREEGGAHHCLLCGADGLA